MLWKTLNNTRTETGGGEALRKLGREGTCEIAKLEKNVSLVSQPRIRPPGGIWHEGIQDLGNKPLAWHEALVIKTKGGKTVMRPKEIIAQQEVPTNNETISQVPGHHGRWPEQAQDGEPRVPRTSSIFWLYSYPRGQRKWLPLFWNLRGLLGKQQGTLVNEPKEYYHQREEKAEQYIFNLNSLVQQKLKKHCTAITL